LKIYTRTGDDGKTGLLGPGRVDKDCPRIEAYGTVDELNAAIGLARSLGLRSDDDQLLAAVQDDLFSVGAALADPDPRGKFQGAITPAKIRRLEEAIDALEAELPPLDRFILPGGTHAAAQLHVARTICRRAERRVIRLSHIEGEHVPHAAIVYLNRLSDFLFVLGRAANKHMGVADVPWRGL
jgi:cob(I)alamin adenosyltransferase